MDREPLQTDELDRYLREWWGCSLIHLPTHTHVDITRDSRNERAPWQVSYTHDEILDKAILERALALDFVLSASPRGDRLVFGLSREFFGLRAAAIKALLLARMLPGVPEDAWLWITQTDCDQFEIPDPEPPSIWPSVS